MFPLAIYFIQICEPEVAVSKNDLEMSLIHRWEKIHCQIKNSSGQIWFFAWSEQICDL